MTTAYTSLLGLALPVTGELSGTWGQTVNDSITSLLDSAVAGTTNVSTDADVTLTTTTGAANTAREAILLFSGSRTALRTVTAPAQSKIYTVINATTGGFSVKLVGAGPTTGVTIVAGESAVCAWNGSDFVKVSNTGGTASFTNVTVTGTTTLSGLTASTALALDASKNVVSVTNTGTGNNVLSASPTLTGTVGGASLTLSSLTSGRVTYAGTSGLLQDSANLTYDGTTTSFVGRLYNGSASTFGASSWAMSLGNGGVSANYFKADSTYWQNAAGTQTMQLSGGTLTTANDASVNGLTVGRGAGAVSTNTAVGASAMVATATGDNNSAFGANALNAVTSGGLNTAIGSASMFLNTTGANNTGVGVLSFRFNTTGSYNTAVGTSALYSNTTASNNTAVGYQAGYSNTTVGSGSTIMGYQAAYSATDTIDAIGYQSAYATTTGTYNSAFGVLALRNNTTGSSNVALGRQALQANTTATGSASVGYQSLFSNTTGAYNTAMGFQALYSNTTGTPNTAIGAGTLAANTTGSNIVAIGANALAANTTASNNTAVGYQAGYSTTTGAQNTFIGRICGLSTTGSYNTFIGDNSGQSVTSGAKNTILGCFSGNGGGLDIRTADNYIVLSDGDGNPRAFCNGSGYWVFGGSSNLSSAQNSIYYTPGTTYGLGFKPSTNSSSPKPCSFLEAGGAEVGSITTSGSGTLYNITSDERLKENIVDALEFGSVIDSIQVRSFDWKRDQIHQRAGFIAQELLTVAPEAVYQPSDTEQMMAVDYSKLVPMLVKEIQSLRKRLANAGI